MLQLLFDLEYPHWMMMAGAIKPLQGGFRAPHGCIRLTLNELGLRGGKMTTEEEAIEIANATRYGLASGIWTRDLNRMHRVTREIRSGMVWVNTYRASAAQTPLCS